MFNKKQLINKIRNLDLFITEMLEKDSDKIGLLIIGGASLIISEISKRETTTDIDVFVTDTNDWNLLSFGKFFNDEIEDEISNMFDINSHVYFFKLKSIIPELKMEYIPFEMFGWNLQLNSIELYTLNLEGIVFTKLLVMMEEDPERNDRDYVDIKDTVDDVDLNILNKYIKVWKNKFARKSELEKFDKAYNRWLGK